MFFSRRKFFTSPVTIKFAEKMYSIGFPLTLKNGRVVNILEREVEN